MDDDINESTGSFGKSTLSNSIYFEDPNAKAELSKIMFSELTEDEQQKSFCDLNEKNEFKNAYKKQEKIPDKKMQDNFNDEKIKAIDLQYKSNLEPNQYTKFKSNKIKEEDNLFLKIEDFPENSIAESFFYDDIVDKINYLIPIYENDLNKINLNSLRLENISKGKGLEVMVEETYGYDKYIKNQMIE